LTKVTSKRCRGGTTSLLNGEWLASELIYLLEQYQEVPDDPTKTKLQKSRVLFIDKREFKCVVDLANGLPPMTEIESLVAGFKSDVALAVGQHRRIVGAGNVGNFCKSIDFHRQRYGAKLEGLRHQGFDGAEIDAAAAQIARLANDAIDKAQRSGVVEFHRR
jgi:hypothetical protein